MKVKRIFTLDMKSVMRQVHNNGNELEGLLPDHTEVAQRRDLISRAVVLMQQGLRLRCDCDNASPHISSVRQLG
jgi:hypothetical protein